MNGGNNNRKRQGPDPPPTHPQQQGRQRAELIADAAAMGPPAAAGTEAKTATQDASLRPPPSPEVLKLWIDVGKGLDKNQTVVWKKAVESLQSAYEHLATNTDARQFAETYARKILEILAAQSPTKIGLHERASVQKAMEFGCLLVVRDLQIRIQNQNKNNHQHQQGEGGDLADQILPHLFDKTKTYYRVRRVTAAAAATAATAGGLPEVRLTNIETFRKADGFWLWQHAYMNEEDHQMMTKEEQRTVTTTPEKNRHGGNGNFPNLKTAALLLAVLSESAAPSLSPAVVAARSRTAPEDEAMAIQLSKSIMQYLSSRVIMTDGKDDALPLSPTMGSDIDLHGILQSLHGTYNALMGTTTGRQAAMDFYAFWRRLTKSMISNPLLEIQLAGWKQVLELIEAAVEHRPLPRTYVVAGAGCQMVNGEYHLAGAVTSDGYFVGTKDDVKYVRTVQQDSDDGSKKLTLFRCIMRSRQKWWFLSEADEEQPGTDRDIDYYQHKSKEHEEAHPSPSGWITCRAAGIDPPPTLQSVGVMVPSGQEGETLEHQLAKWAMENEILEGILGDTVTIHGSVVAKSTALVKFVESMRNRSDNDLKEKITALLNKLLLRAWEVSQCIQQQDLSNRGVLNEIAKLVAILLPMADNDVSLCLIQAIREMYEDQQSNDNDKQQLWAVAGICASLASFVDPTSEQVTGLVGDGLAEEVRDLVFMVARCPEVQLYLSAYAILYPFDRSPLDDCSDHDEEEDADTTTVRYAGMVNLGSTGYMTVVLQQLFMAPLVRNFILSLSNGDVSASKLLEELRSMFRHLALALQLPLPSEAQATQEISEEALRVGLPLIRSFVEVYDPSTFVDECRRVLKLENGARGQNDACDFYQQLLSVIVDQLKTVPAAAKSLGTVMFLNSSRGKTCQRCGTTTIRQERILRIDCPINESASLVDALNTITKGELMAGANRVHCDDCGGSSPATILKSGFSDFPEVLIFSLKRFALNLQTTETYKTDKRFAFEKLLRLYPYCLENDHQTESLSYRLVGVVVHTGAATGGTYMSLIRERNGAKRWLQFADEKVTVFAAEELAEVCFGGHVSEEAAKLGRSSRNATMLVYERVEGHQT